MKTIILGCLLIIGGLFWTCQDKDLPADTIETVPPKTAGITINDSTGKVITQIIAEIADSDYARTKGLMKRQNLAPHEGMLFIFEEEKMQSFWMKNTSIELDLIFISQKMKIVHINHKAQPYTLASIPSRYPARYVLEVMGGYCETYGVQPEQFLTIR